MNTRSLKTLIFPMMLKIWSYSLNLLCLMHTFRNTQPIPNIAMAADRYGVSNRATAAIATAALIDFGLITPEDQSLVTDKNKVARAREKYRRQLQMEERMEINDIFGIYFDGRYDSTLSKVEIKGKWHPKTIMEEHYVVICQNGTYLFHTSPESGHGIQIASSIYANLEKLVLKEKILLVGCDGTNVNVGWKNGAIVNLEKMLGRELQWAVCLLHTIELPLRHIFEYFDGKTSGPISFSGPIGKLLKGKLSHMSVINFDPIRSDEFPNMRKELVDDFSTDQYFLYRICQACIKGIYEEDLVVLEPGPICHSRWLTLACRIVRLYMSTANPSFGLKRLTIIVVKFYAPCWFYIKSHFKFTDGPKNYFWILHHLTNLSSDEQDIAKKTLQRNAFFFTP